MGRHDSKSQGGQTPAGARLATGNESGKHRPEVVQQRAADAHEAARLAAVQTAQSTGR